MKFLGGSTILHSLSILGDLRSVILDFLSSRVEKSMVAARGWLVDLLLSRSLTCDLRLNLLRLLGTLHLADPTVIECRKQQRLRIILGPWDKFDKVGIGILRL